MYTVCASTVLCGNAVLRAVSIDFFFLFSKEKISEFSRGKFGCLS